MTSVSAGHIILTPSQPVGSGRPQRESRGAVAQLVERTTPGEEVPGSRVIIACTYL